MVILLAALSANAAALPQFAAPAAQQNGVNGLLQPNPLGIFQPVALPSLLSALNPPNAASSAALSINFVVSNPVASAVSATASRTPLSGSTSSTPSASGPQAPSFTLLSTVSAAPTAAPASSSDSIPKTVLVPAAHLLPSLLASLLGNFPMLSTRSFRSLPLPAKELTPLQSAATLTLRWAFPAS